MKKSVYLDNAATTYPKPECVYYQVYKVMRDMCGNPGRGSNKMALAASKILYEARRKLASYFTAPLEENIIFTYNATYALNIAIKCFIRRQSHVLISDVEHNAVYRPIVSESLKGNISYSIFDTFSGESDKILEEIRQKTRFNTSAIVCTASSNICSLRLPIEKIAEYAKRNNLLFILDGSQMAGHEKIVLKDSGISIFCAPFHKALYGPQGGGFLIVNEGIMPQRSFIEGGSGYDSKNIKMPPTLPEMFEAGTVSTPSAAGLCASIEYLENAKAENIQIYEKKIFSLMRNVIKNHPRLKIHGDYGMSSVISVTAEGIDTEQFASMLDENDIYVRGGFHCAPLAHKKLGTYDSGSVRFSCGIFNTEEDMYILDNVLSKILN